MRRLPLHTVTSLIAILSSTAIAQRVDQAPTPEKIEAATAQRANQFVDAVNSNSNEAIHQFLDDAAATALTSRMPKDRLVQALRSFYRSSQGLELGNRIDDGDANPSTAQFRMHNKLQGSWLTLHINVDPSGSHLLSDFHLSPTSDPNRSPEPLTDADIVQRAAEFIERLADAEVFSGAVLIAKGDSVLYQAAHGMASHRFAVPNKVDTKFAIASIAKPFTSVAIMQLVEAGLISLDDAASDYLSEDWLSPSIGERIQIRHLLSHTSGLGDWRWDEFNRLRRDKLRTVEAYRAVVPGKSLLFEPGSRSRYSNSAMILLGAIIEKVTGEDYYDYVRDNVFQRAGMHDTDFYIMDRPVANLAIGYTWDERDDGLQWTNNTLEIPARGFPGGGAFSTVADLHAFTRAMRNGTLVSPQSRDMMWSPKSELGNNAYGYGFSVKSIGPDTIVGHSGGSAGVSTNLDLFLDGDYTVITLSNYAGGSGPLIFKLRELIGQRARAARQ